MSSISSPWVRKRVYVQLLGLWPMTKLVLKQSSSRPIGLLFVNTGPYGSKKKKNSKSYSSLKLPLIFFLLLLIFFSVVLTKSTVWDFSNLEFHIFFRKFRFRIQFSIGAPLLTKLDQLHSVESAGMRTHCCFDLSARQGYFGAIQ